MKTQTIAAIFLFSLGCGSPLHSASQNTAAASTPSSSELLQPSAPTAADAAFADVFRALDGEWKGEFSIYVDTRGQAERAPTVLDPTLWKEAPFRLQQTISVTQRYTSETPYFQRVAITDTYQDSSGTTKNVESSGVNKVQNGALWCFVQKPSETVLHTGISPKKDVIIWQRDERNPLKKEYFEETVSANTYEIRGWGMYGSDDPSKGPRMYFHGLYKR